MALNENRTANNTTSQRRDEDESGEHAMEELAALAMKDTPPPAAKSDSPPQVRLSQKEIKDLDLSESLGFQVRTDSVKDQQMLERAVCNQNFVAMQEILRMTDDNWNLAMQNPSAGRMLELVVAGITHACTGTRTTKEGKSFAIAEIGNLTDRRVLRVLLWKDAYSKYVNQLKISSRAPLRVVRR